MRLGAATQCRNPSPDGRIATRKQSLSAAATTISKLQFGLNCQDLQPPRPVQAGTLRGRPRRFGVGTSPSSVSVRLAPRIRFPILTRTSRWASSSSCLSGAARRRGDLESGSA